MLHDEKMIRQREETAGYRAMRLANDPEYYRGLQAEKMRMYREEDPEKHREAVNKLKKAIVAIKEFYCELCKVFVDGEYALERHNEPVKHLKKAEYLKKPDVCTICSWGCNKLGHYNEHLKSVRHFKMKAEASKTTMAAKAAGAILSAAQSSTQLV